MSPQSSEPDAIVLLNFVKLTNGISSSFAKVGSREGKVRNQYPTESKNESKRGASRENPKVHKTRAPLFILIKRTNTVITYQKMLLKD